MNRDILSMLFAYALGLVAVWAWVSALTSLAHILKGT